MPQPTEPSLEQQRRYVRQWKRTGKLLRKIKMEELAALTDEQARKDTEDLLQLANSAYRHPRLKRYSGLIEQQKLFAQMRDEHH